jgi:hypothetical protein
VKKLWGKKFPPQYGGSGTVIVKHAEKITATSIVNILNY